MAIDYAVVGQIGSGLVLLVAGALLNRFLERRAKVIVFYGHVGVFQLQQPPMLQAPQQPQPQPPPQFIHTHVIVIRNAGRIAAQMCCSVRTTSTFQFFQRSRTPCVRCQTTPKRF